jgi:hypothetical protein
MQALDSFNSPILGFEGDIPFLAIPVSTWSPSGESVSDPSVGASAGASKTRASKRKAAEEIVPESPKPLSPGSAQGSPGAGGAPSSPT